MQSQMKSQMKKRSLIALTSLFFTVVTLGCGGPLSRVAPNAAQKPQGPPRIDRAIDLGSMPLPATGAVNQSGSDKLFTAGEWIALQGANLSALSKVSVGGRAAVTAGNLSDGSLLLRMPRGVAPGMQTLTLDNGLGSATATLATGLFVFAADTQGDALRIRRLGPEGEGFAEHEVNIELPKARYQVLSPDGGFLYALQEPSFEVWGLGSLASSVGNAAQSVSDQGGPCELIIVHLGQKGGPRKLGQVPLTLDSRPMGMAMSPRGQLVVVQKRKLMILDASNPLELRIVSQMPLTVPQGAERAIVDAEFVDGGRLLAILEAYGNQVLLIDLANPLQPRQVADVQLARTQSEPFSIDLAVSADDRSLWVLQGPNLRLGGKRLLDGLRTTFGDVKTLDFQAAGRAISQTATDTAMTGSLSRVVQLVLEGDALRLSRSIALPSDLFPFFVVPDRDGSLYVSGVNRTNPFQDVQASLDGVLRLLQALKNTVQLGSVIKVGTEDGRLTTVLQGMAIYYDMALLPSGQLITSTMRLGPGYLPPRITLDWGLEITGGQFHKLREVANTGLKITGVLERLLPPYRYERIGTQ